MTMVANEEVANWIPCYRRTEIFMKAETRINMSNLLI